MNLSRLKEIRKALEKAFSQDTRAPNTPDSPYASAGHCAAVAYILYVMFGGSLFSTKSQGPSHWYNRINGFDIDLTGDQFGLATIQITSAGGLYPDSKFRYDSEVNEETFQRALRLAQRAGFPPLQSLPFFPYTRWETKP